MNEQRIQQLLREADAVAGQRPPRPLDARELEQIVDRCRKRRRVASASAALVVLAAVVVFAMGRGRGYLANTTVEQPAVLSPVKEPTAMDRSSAEQFRAEIAELDRQIEARRDQIAQLQAAQRLDRLQSELAALLARSLAGGPSAAAVAEARRSESAAISLAYANLLAAGLGDDRLAAVEYQNIVQHYPGTKWSQAAQEALQSLGQMQ